MATDQQVPKVGLGTSVVGALAAQLGGELAMASSAKGTKVSISKRAAALATPLLQAV